MEACKCYHLLSFSWFRAHVFLSSPRARRFQCLSSSLSFSFNLPLIPSVSSFPSHSFIQLDNSTCSSPFLSLLSHLLLSLLLLVSLATNREVSNSLEEVLLDSNNYTRVSPALSTECKFSPSRIEPLFVLSDADGTFNYDFLKRESAAVKSKYSQHVATLRKRGIQVTPNDNVKRSTGTVSLTDLISGGG